jgi:hypothetical protein
VLHRTGAPGVRLVVRVRQMPETSGPMIYVNGLWLGAIGTYLYQAALCAHVAPPILCDAEVGPGAAQWRSTNANMQRTMFSFCASLPCRQST